MMDIDLNLLAAILGLSEAQKSGLSVLINFAKARKIKLNNLHDFKLLTQKWYRLSLSDQNSFGKISESCISYIQRACLELSTVSPVNFAEQPLGLEAILSQESDLRGTISIADLTAYANMPELYAGYVISLLNQCVTRLPENKDDRPVLAILMDEAHYLFNHENPKLNKLMERLVRVLRSKGVALIFASQKPEDIPDGILSQLQTKIIHGLYASSPRDNRAVKSLCEMLPEGGDWFSKIKTLGVGEAIATTIGVSGRPTKPVIAKITPMDTPKNRICVQKNQPTPTISGTESESFWDRELTQSQKYHMYISIVGLIILYFVS